MAIIVKDYIRADQSNPFQQWMKNLDRHAKSKVEQAIFRLGMGNTSAINWFGGIGEYRIDWGPGYRIYLVQDGAKLIILFAAAQNSASRQISLTPKCSIKNTSNAKNPWDTHHDYTDTGS